MTNQFESGGKYGVEEMRFADGAIWTKAQIARLSATNATLVDGRPILGNSGDESRTVEGHLQKVCLHLGVRTRFQAVLNALDLGLLTHSP